MPSYDFNAYYHPENLNLELIASVDVGGDWEFEILGCWKDKDGQIWTASDSGCSCPTPFEDHEFPENFLQVESMGQVEEAINALPREPSSNEAAALREAVHAALKSP